ncbi:hypothetical protein AMECASPLE_039030 [Ameca splendens]|uniref:Uncharacterized protein n=1 Tax=Ameca splendens TaxID=208324 RepID=A0ABV0Y925_9TELE
MRSAEDLGSSARLTVMTCVIIIIFLGGGIFLFLAAFSKWFTTKPKTKAGGYQKLDTNSDCPPQPTTSWFGDYTDRITECENNDEEYDDEDIVYMTKDGTVYRKFKYGLLDDDDVELEYDDESYSFR